MSESSIVWPCIAMVALTAVVWVGLLIERLGEIRARKLSPQMIATARQVAGVLQHQQASDNFRNLFEVPVLFYALCILLLASGSVTEFQVVAAWGFVGLRAMHSLIHCTYNNVMHRFVVYLLSSVLVFLMWGVFAYGRLFG